MDPISIAIELELGALLLAGVSAVATWLHHKRQHGEHRARERRHLDRMDALEEGKMLVLPYREE